MKPTVIAYLMAIYANNPCIQIFKKKCSKFSILLPFHIFQIISMNNSYNQAEFSFPSLPMMKPCKVLRLLKDGHICIVVRDYFRNIANGKNAPFIQGKLDKKLNHKMVLLPKNINKVQMLGSYYSVKSIGTSLKEKLNVNKPHP